MPHRNYPRIQERIILVNTWLSLTAVIQDAFRGSKISQDYQSVILSIASGSFQNRSMSVAKIVEKSGVPRATVQRRITWLLANGFIKKVGRNYCISDYRMANPTVNTDKANRIILRAAERLKSAQSGQ